MNKEQAKLNVESESLLRQEAMQSIKSREAYVSNQKFGDDVVRNKNEPVVDIKIIDTDDIEDSLLSELYVESKYQAKQYSSSIKELKGKEPEGSFLNANENVQESKYVVLKDVNKISKTKFGNTAPKPKEGEQQQVPKKVNTSNVKYETKKGDNTATTDKLFKVSEDKLSDAIAKVRKSNTKLSEAEVRQKAYFSQKLEPEVHETPENELNSDDAIVVRTFSKNKLKSANKMLRGRRTAGLLSGVKYHVTNNAYRIENIADNQRYDNQKLQDVVYDEISNSGKYVALIPKQTVQAISKVKDLQASKHNTNSIAASKSKYSTGGISILKPKSVVTSEELATMDKRVTKRFLLRKKKEEQIFADMQISFARKVVSKIKQIASRNKIGVIVAAVVLAFSLAAVGSIGIVFDATSEAVGIYLSGLSLSTDFDMTDCENYFTKMEADLQEVVDNIEEYYPGYDRYDLSIDPIGHDSLKLMAYLSAEFEGYNLENIKEILDLLFDDMYVITIEEETEIVDDEEILVFKMTIEKTDWDELMASRIHEEKTDLYDSYEKNGGGHQSFHSPFTGNWSDKISSEFGWRIHPISGEEKFHKGVDIAMPSGTPINSCSEGVVIKSYYSESAGNYVVVEDETGYQIHYMHMSDRYVAVGDKVDYDTIIGSVGSTGYSTGPHLHLQVTDNNGEYLNPKFMVQGGY